MKTPVLILIALLCFGMLGCQSDTLPLTTDSDEARQAFIEGRNLVEKLRGRESYDHFARAATLDTNFALAYLNLAMVSPTQREQHIWLKKTHSKLDLISEGEQYYCLGIEAGYMGVPGKQREYFLKLAGMFPKDARVQTLLGNHYFGNLEYDLAISQYKTAVKLDPNYSVPYNQLGYCYRFQGDYSRAESAFKKYISLIPDDPNPYDSYAELLLQMGEYEVSIEMYEKAIAINPGFANSYFGIATNLILRDEHNLARKKLKDLFHYLDNNGQRRQALTAMAISYIDEGKYEFAQKVLEKQLAIAQTNQDSLEMAADHNLIGFVFLQAGRIAEAESTFKMNAAFIASSSQPLEIKKTWTRIFMYNQARIALDKNDIPLAWKMSKEYHAEAAEAGNFYQMRTSHELAGMIFFAEKKYEESIQEFMQANLQNPQTLYRMAQVYEAKDDISQAVDYYQRAAFANAFNNINYAFIRKDALKKFNLLK